MSWRCTTSDSMTSCCHAQHAAAIPTGPNNRRVRATSLSDCSQTVRLSDSDCRPLQLMQLNWLFKIKHRSGKGRQRIWCTHLENDRRCGVLSVSCHRVLSLRGQSVDLHLWFLPMYCVFILRFSSCKTRCRYKHGKQAGSPGNLLNETLEFYDMQQALEVKKERKTWLIFEDVFSSYIYIFIFIYLCFISYVVCDIWGLLLPFLRPTPSDTTEAPIPLDSGEINWLPSLPLPLLSSLASSSVTLLRH